MNSNAQWFAIGALTCAACFTLGGTGKSADRPEFIRATGLSIVAEDGEERVRIAALPDGGSLVISNPDGDNRIVLASSTDSSGVNMYSHSGANSVGLLTNDAFSVLRLKTPSEMFTSVSGAGEPKGDSLTRLTVQQQGVIRWEVMVNPDFVSQSVHDREGLFRSTLYVDDHTETLRMIPAAEARK